MSPVVGLGHADAAILRPGGRDESPVRVERLPDGARLSRHGGDLVARIGVPDLQETVVAGGREDRAVGRELDVVHVAVRMPDPRPDGIAGRGVAEVDDPGVLRALGHEDALGAPIDGPAQVLTRQHDP